MYICICMYVSFYVYTRICKYVDMSIFVSVEIYTHIYIYIHIYICICICICIYSGICICMCICICIYILYVCICIYIDTYVYEFMSALTNWDSHPSWDWYSIVFVARGMWVSWVGPETGSISWTILATCSVKRRCTREMGWIWW